MGSNYRILEDGQPIAWFVFSKDAAEFVKTRPAQTGKLLNVEMTGGPDNMLCLSMELSRHGNLLLTEEAQKTIATIQ